MVCCTHSNDDERFIDIGTPNRIWTIPSIHSDVWQLVRTHDALLDKIQPGDRLIYLGNYIGYGETPLETIDEVLTFRRMLLSKAGMIPSDIIFLRGVQEEMWLKLLQLHFAPNPYGILGYIIDNGMETMLRALGTSAEDGLRVTREGVLSMTKWTNFLREQIRKRQGFDKFFSVLKRAAYTCASSDAPLLFVNAGVDPLKPLQEQTDSFWWSGKNFNAINQNYQNFHKVIRGYDPNHEGPNLNCVTASLDGGCGFGGPLLTALINPHIGEIDNILHA